MSYMGHLSDTSPIKQPFEKSSKKRFSVFTVSTYVLKSTADYVARYVFTHFFGMITVFLHYQKYLSSRCHGDQKMSFGS